MDEGIESESCSAVPYVHGALRVRRGSATSAHNAYTVNKTNSVGNNLNREPKSAVPGPTARRERARRGVEDVHVEIHVYVPIYLHDVRCARALRI